MIEIITQILPTVLLAIGFFWGIYQYFDKRGRESKKPFLDRQLEFYVEACEAVSKLSTLDKEKGDEEWKKAEKQFWQLYYGKLVLVEDEEVASAMEEFRKSLVNPSANQSELKSKSMNVARMCQASLEKKWG